MVDWGRWSSLACRMNSDLSYMATALFMARLEIGAGVPGISVFGLSGAFWAGLFRWTAGEGCEGSRTVFCQCSVRWSQSLWGGWVLFGLSVRERRGRFSSMARACRGKRVFGIARSLAYRRRWPAHNSDRNGRVLVSVCMMQLGNMRLVEPDGSPRAMRSALRRGTSSFFSSAFVEGHQISAP